MKKIIKALVLIVPVILFGCDSKKETALEKNTEYKLTSKENRTYKILLIDEIDSISQGQQVTSEPLLKKIIGEYTVLSSTKLQTEYEKNEVKADLNYRKKLIIINGKVLSIDRGIGEDYFISLNGGSNMFINPKINMADGYTEFLAGLNKGDFVSLVCQGNGMLLGSAMANKCEPLLNYASKKVDTYLKGFSLSENLVKTSPSELQTSLISMVASSQLPDNSSCYKETNYYEKKCTQEIQNLKVFKKDKVEFQKQLELNITKAGLNLEDVKSALK